MKVLEEKLTDACILMASMMLAKCIAVGVDPESTRALAMSKLKVDMVCLPEMLKVKLGLGPAAAATGSFQVGGSSSSHGDPTTTTRVAELAPVEPAKKRIKRMT